jgi:tRNA(Ile)-lysidine synthase
MAGAPEDRGGAVEADAGGRGAPGVVFVRPLLALRKAEIRAALSAAGACWHEDNTNAQDAHLRNRIRHHVAPVWERVQERDSVAGVLRSRRLLDEDAAALEAWAGDAWADIAGAREVAILPRSISALDWRPAAGLPVAIQRRLVRKALCLLAPGAMPGAGVVDSVAGALVAGRAGRWNVAAGGTLVFDGVTLRVDRQHPGDSSFGPSRIFAPLVAGGGLFWTTPAAGTAGGEMASLREDPDGAGGDARLVAGWLSLERVVLSGTEFSRLCAGHFSPDRLACLALAPEGEGGGGAPAMGFPPAVPFRVRQWRAGDSYRPLGAAGRRKLSDMFGERGIPAAARHVLPVVCDAVTGGILWVPGLPPAHAWRLRTCSPCFRLTWKPAFSTSPRSVTLAETQTRQI